MTSIPYDYDQDDWGAQRVFADGDLEGRWDVDKWVIHYGGNATDAATNAALEPWALRIYEQAHLSRGWRAIAYNYAVGNSGAIYRLRGENPSGATSGDLDDDGIPENNEARAVLWIGGGDQKPSAEAYASMRRLINSDPWIGITVHSDHKATRCPGDYWRHWVADEGWNDDGGDMEYRGVANVPDTGWARSVIDYGIASGLIVIDDDYPDDWNDDTITMGRLWTLFYRFGGE